MVLVSREQNLESIYIYIIKIGINYHYRRWADALITKHNELYISGSGCSHNSPTVKYRGIFLNDEQPALQNWAMEKFTNGTGSPIFNSPFNVNFYSQLYVISPLPYFPRLKTLKTGLSLSFV